MNYYKYNKKNIILKKVLLSVFILISSTNITNLPIPFKYNIEAVFLVIGLMLGLFVLYKHVFLRRIVVYKNELVLFVIIAALLVLVAAVLANRQFGQPIYYGLMAGRRAVYALSGLILFWLLKEEFINLFELEKAFVFTFTILLTFYLLMNFVKPPEQFTQEFDMESVLGFVTFDEGRGLYRYRFDMDLIFFGLIFSFLNRKHPLYFFLFILIVFYFLYLFRGRILIISALLIFSIHFLFVARLKSKVNIFISVALIISSVLLLFEVFHFESIFLQKSLHFFIDTFNIIIGDYGFDPSANSRILQSGLAWHYIEISNYMGVGRLSNKWISHGSLFGYFNPSDIGIIGIWFVYGILGLISYVVLIAMVIRMFLKRPRTQNSFQLSCWLYVIYLLFSSLMTGRIFYMGWGQFSIMLAILYYSNLRNRNGINEKY